jgi:cell division protein FtsB
MLCVTILLFLAQIIQFMATRTKLTPFARMLLFLIFLVPLAYGGALYLQGKDPIAEVKGMMNGEESSASSKSSSTYNSQQEIEKLKKENRELKQKVKDLEAKIKEQESGSSTREKWGN